MTIRSFAPLAGALLLLALAVPAPTHAASSRPTCSLSVTTQGGTVSTRRSADAFAVYGETVSIAWESRNARSATGPGGTDVPLQGTSTLVASTSADISYKFKGSRTVTCTIDLEVVRATISPIPASEDGPDTISGSIQGAKRVRVTVERDGDRVISSTVRTKGRSWRLPVRRDLQDGSYVVTVYGTEGRIRNRELARATFTVGESGTVSASMVPLLFGGTVRAGGSVPVAYVKLVNSGALPVTVSGFDLVQNGTAPAGIVNGFTTSDDKGGSLSVIGGPGSRPFQGNTAFVPLPAIVNPGQLRIFSIKALVDASASSYVGTQLRIDVSGVRTDAGVIGVFPLRGTTWTVSY